MTEALTKKSKALSINVRVSGALRDHVEFTTQDGDYESVSEYVRDLIRRDKACHEEAKFEALKAQLQLRFAADETSYLPTTFDDIRNLAKARLG